MTPKEKFLNLTYEIKQTGIAKELYSTQNAEELRQVWQDFQNENEELISKIREWEFKHLNSGYDGEDIFAEGEDIENAMEIAICIRLMRQGGSEIYIFENENTLSDALGEINNNFAKRVSILSYNEALKGINAEDIFKNVD